MTLDALNSEAPPYPHFTDVAPVSLTQRNRSKPEFDDYYFAECLIALARSGGDTSSSAATVDAKNQTNLSSSTPTITSCNCTLCGKFFSTRLALRRHRASHHSDPSTAPADDGEPSNSTSTAGTGPSESISGSHRHHKCSTCGEIFPSGQALGGHKRKHYGGIISRNGGRKSRLNSSDGGAASTDVSSSSDSDMAEMAPIVRNLGLKPPSPYLDLTLKL